MAVPKWLESVSKVAGAVAPITGAAAPILGALGSLFGAKQQSKSVAEANAAQLQIARENNSAQERMLLMNNAFNRQNALEMFNLENAYNSPENMHKLLVEGGYNPATMYQNGGQIARSDGATAQAASSGITPTMPNIQPVPSTIGAMFGNFEALSRVASNLAEAGLSGAQKNRIELLMDEELNSILADNALKELQGQINALQLRFEREFGRIDRQTSLGLKVSEIWMNFQNSYKMACEGDLASAEAAYKDSVTELNKLEYSIKDKSKQAIIDLAFQTFENAKKEGRRIDSATKLNQAQASEASAQAGVLRQEERRLVDTYQSFVDEQNAKSGKEVLSYVRDLTTQKEQIYQIIESCAKTTAEKEAAEHEAERAFHLAELAEKENSSYYGRLCINALGTILGAGGIAVGAFKVFGKSKPTKVSGFE